MKEQQTKISRRTFLGGVVAFGTISLTINPVTAFATPTAAEKQAEADGVRAQVQALKAELVDLSNAYGAALDEHDAALLAMEQAQVSIEEKNTHIASLQDKLGTRAKSMYRNGNSTFLDILFGSTTFDEFATNWDILNTLNESDAQLVDETKTLREELEVALAEYEAQEQIAADKAEEARIAKEEGEATAAHYQKILEELDEETRQLLAAEEQAAAAAAAAAALATQEQSSQDSSQTGNVAPGLGSGGGSVADYGPPAGDVVTEAMKYIGVPYEYGGNTPAGFDCSGFVNYCLARCGRGVPPRSTYNYPNSGWFPVSEAQPGDILWQRSHVGICISAGGGSYIHAPQPGGTVSVSSWSQFVRAYRY